MAKIVLFADGTGNARTAQFRTNVWKLYVAIDSRPESGQIAYYHDGVGTSAFAPLRLLGGIFGFGLARNIRALYAFLCRNLREDTDEIHLFGFSRGAFTVRILAGLIACQGVRHIGDEAELDRWVRDAYSCNRLRLALAQVGGLRRALFTAGAALLGVGRERAWSAPKVTPDIALIGVWDTVAAYGGPIIEMVRGFDRWVWPLSMPDYRLSGKVRRARHALSLDEEREAFLPLPWDEVGSSDPERIKQVWFAGVHSDVGGGYADDSLSSIALAWMLDEAKAAGLAFMPAAEAAIRDSANAWGPLHDSRSGLAVAYRYQPRSINALMGLTPNSPLRDPESGDAPLMTDIVVHDSVIARVRDPDGYAPIVLPTEFRDDRGRRVSLPAGQRDDIWAAVRTRQALQRLLLVTAALALFAPLLPRSPWIVVVDQMLAPVLGAALGLVPFLPDGLHAAYAGAGFWLSLCAAAILLWLALGDRARARIGRLATAMWDGKRIGAAGVVAVAAARSRSNRLLAVSLAVRRQLRWTILPGVFGLGFYVVVALLVVTGVNQVALTVRELDGDLCPATGPAGDRFATREPCHRLGVRVLAAHRYRVRLVVGSAWSDDRKTLPTSPVGFTYVDSFKAGWRAGGPVAAVKGAAVHLFGITIRRGLGAHWFQPVIAIRNPDSQWLYRVPLSPQVGSDGSYYARFVAPVDGDVSIYVNDAVVPGAPADAFYTNNDGDARVEIAENN